MKPYPSFICAECFAKSTCFVLAVPDSPEFEELVFEPSAACDLCGKHAPLQEPKNLGYPQWDDVEGFTIHDLDLGWHE